MRVLLYQDRTLKVDLIALADNLNRLLPPCSFKVGTSEAKIAGRTIMLPASYNQLPAELQQEIMHSQVRLGIIFTAKRYDNNYFYDTDRKIVIVSFCGWRELTTLPAANGAGYFIAKLLAEEIGAGGDHKRSQGCINDFRLDKSAVHFGMLGASICTSCLERFGQNRPSRKERLILNGIRKLLNGISDASRSGRDLIAYWQSSLTWRFDVFLCHNSKNKEAIRLLADRLKSKGLRPWLDEEQIRPGERWQGALEEEIARIGAAAVCIGQNGIGPWQDMEIKTFLDQMLRRGCPVIPVILEGCSDTPVLPPFLSQLMWVDFRKRHPDPLKQLVWGITKNRPGSQ
jgi:hypothetical protein